MFVVNTDLNSWLKPMSRSFVVILAIGMCLGLVTTARAGTLTGRVVHIADGDTITVLDSNNQQFKIRLTGIDAPEKSQAFGSKSQANLGAILSDQITVNIEWSKRDQYGRILGKVLISPQDSPCIHQPECPKTEDANLLQVKAGMAWWYRHYAKEQPHAAVGIQSSIKAYCWVSFCARLAFNSSIRAMPSRANSCSFSMLA